MVLTQDTERGRQSSINTLLAEVSERAYPKPSREETDRLKLEVISCLTSSNCIAVIALKLAASEDLPLKTCHSLLWKSWQVGAARFHPPVVLPDFFCYCCTG